MADLNYKTLKVRFQDTLCFIEFDRAAANNTINDQLIADFNDVLTVCEASVAVLVISGSPEIFCFGADFAELANANSQSIEGPARIYDLWLRLATGPYVTVAHVRGKVNAGGVGFVAASDIVLADESAQFSLSEMLFGLYPACVLPFLVRRIGFQRAHYLTLMTHPITALKATEWGLVDACEPQSDILLRRHLLRLRRLSKTSVRKYKAYIAGIYQPLADLKSAAVAANLEVFSDEENLQAIARFVEQGVFPWEKPE